MKQEGEDTGIARCSDEDVVAAIGKRHENTFAGTFESKADIAARLDEDEALGVINIGVSVNDQLVVVGKSNCKGGWGHTCAGGA